LQCLSNVHCQAKDTATLAATGEVSAQARWQVQLSPSFSSLLGALVLYFGTAVVKVSEHVQEAKVEAPPPQKQFSIAQILLRSLSYRFLPILIL